MALQDPSSQNLKGSKPAAGQLPRITFVLPGLFALRRSARGPFRWAIVFWNVGTGCELFTAIRGPFPGRGIKRRNQTLSTCDQGIGQSGLEERV